MSMKNWIPDDLYERITGTKRKAAVKKVAKKSKQQKLHEKELKKQYKQMKREEEELKELEEQNKLIIEKMLENSKIEDRMEEIKSKIQYLKTLKAPVIDNKTSQKEVTTVAVVEEPKVLNSESEDEDGAVATVEENNNNEMDNMYFIKENVSKKTRKKILRILSKYLDKDKKYKFIDMKDGLYKMYFLSKYGELVENIIDPFGTINGGQHPRICKKAMDPNGDTPIGFFDLTLDSNLSKMLLNSEEPFIDYNTGMNIPDNDPYNVTVDFSNTPSLDRLNKDVLLNNLNFALNTMANSGITIPKFRFSDLTDENHFSLISDFKVKLPLQYESVKINGIDTPLSFNKYIDNGRVLSFNNGTIYTGYLHDSSNKVMLYQPPQVQQQSQQQIDQTQLFNNIMNNGLGQGFNQYQQQPISPNIIMA